jgi:pimeloyl-ACP methyl ester carboxylesterase
MAKDASVLINHLQWKQCHVVAISMGGMTALELALIAPEKILSLTLIATHAGGLSGRAPFAGVRHITRALFIRDESSLIENALTMLYSAKTLADSNKRKVCRHKYFIINLFFSLFMIIILKNFENVFRRRLLVL